MPHLPPHFNPYFRRPPTFSNRWKNRKTPAPLPTPPRPFCPAQPPLDSSGRRVVGSAPPPLALPRAPAHGPAPASTPQQLPSQKRGTPQTRPSSLVPRPSRRGVPGVFPEHRPRLRLSLSPLPPRLLLTSHAPKGVLPSGLWLLQPFSNDWKNARNFFQPLENRQTPRRARPPHFALSNDGDMPGLWRFGAAKRRKEYSRGWSEAKPPVRPREKTQARNGRQKPSFLAVAPSGLKDQAGASGGSASLHPRPCSFAASRLSGRPPCT